MSRIFHYCEGCRESTFPVESSDDYYGTIRGHVGHGTYTYNQGYAFRVGNFEIGYFPIKKIGIVYVIIKDGTVVRPIPERGYEMLHAIHKRHKEVKGEGYERTAELVASRLVNTIRKMFVEASDFPWDRK